MNADYTGPKNRTATAGDGLANDFSYQLTCLEGGLRRFAYSLTGGDTECANDLLQETFTKALTNREKYNPDTNMKGWVFTIMKNTFINNYRKGLNTRKYENAVECAAKESGPQVFPVAADSYALANEIENEIKKLGDDFRIPFKMHVEGYMYREIADELDMKLGTVKSNIFHARKKLMKSLGSYS